MPRAPKPNFAMAASAETITKSAVNAISLRWIIGARDDLVWFIGSVVSSYVLLALYVSGLVPLLPMIAFWAILIDAPHVFGTFSRTYFDRSERQNRARLLWGSLLFFAIGPVMVLAGAGFVFLFVAALWAYYHLVKQHYGFMVLYKKKNGDLARIDNALDRALLLFAFNYPFVQFIASDQEAMARVPATLHGFANGLAKILLAGTIVLFVLWLGRQVQRAITGEPLNVPKYLLLAAAIPMHWIVLLTPMPHKTIAIVAILTIYHNLQYHRLIWFHNQKYTDRREKYGAAELISRRVLYYIAFGVIFGVLYQGPRQILNYFGLQNAAAGLQQPLVIQLGGAFLWGYAFVHYYLDSKIWRVRRDPTVGRALHIN
ncbi:MAG: hypothetical protein LC794_14225 [Acidobacteria bacterium]|nr:hypothetical protein [Acidobacteriota bacterium]